MTSVSVDGFIAGPNGERLSPERDGRIAMRVIETRTFGNGVVLLRYEAVAATR